MLLACDIPEKDRGDVSAGRGDQAGVLRQPYCYVCAAVSVELLRKRLCLLVRITRKPPYHPQKLTQEEVAREVIALQDMGHKRLPLRPVRTRSTTRLSTFSSASTPYTHQHKTDAIRRVNVNIAATTVENYRKLKDAGIGTLHSVPGDYHKQSYAKLHPAGPKHDYDYHTEAMDRAMDGGIDDVGLGVLFGLEMYKYEFAGLLMHAEHLRLYGVGPHTISVPRIKRADDIDPDVFDNGLSDENCSQRLSRASALPCRTPA